MARLKVGLQLRELASKLASCSPNEGIRPKVVYAAFKRLRKARPLLSKAFRCEISQKSFHQIQNPKIQLWRALAQPVAVERGALKDLLKYLSKTEAWDQALQAEQTHNERLAKNPWNYQARLNNFRLLLDNLHAEIQCREQSNIFFWHHFDALGYIPQSWKSVLLELRHRGWIVIISSSGIRESDHEYLEKSGFLISLRQNTGLCLGAYRDFCCLLSDHKRLHQQIQTLVLCNDSTLPLGGKEPLCLQVEKMRTTITRKKPALIGLTDSVQTKGYHIQSYFLMLNSQLLKDSCWFKFWEKLSLQGDKDEIIKEGEVGLSQWLLYHNINIEAKYSLTSILLSTPGARPELEQLNLRKPDEINLTLMCWKALLETGFPVIKKQLLLDPPHFLPRSVPMSELSNYLVAADTELIEDLAQLMKSRFHKP